jgi:hypothetical protein
MSKILSKSNYLLGLQCSRLLWVNVNDKKRIPEADESKQKIFDEGHIVGEFAKKLFPEGIDIEDEDFKGNLEETKKLLAKGKPLFEPAFMVDRLYSRADVLEPTKDGWNIIEVKSSTAVKDVNLQDVAFQKYVYEKAGLKINKCFLLHINNQYVRQGELDLEKLFTKEDISINVAEEIGKVPERVRWMLEVIDSKEPEEKISKSCDDPYECAMKKSCWDFLPKENSVFDLYRGGQKSWDLFEKNVWAIKDIPDNFKLGDKQQIQLECEKTGKVHLNEEVIKSFIENLNYPLYFLDFETYSTAIPLYEGLKPYQQIPFQFSLHIQKKESGKVEHISFLADGTDDPRPKFMQALRDNLGDRGSILVYNQGFERGVMNECATAFPEFKEWYEENTMPRVKDLWDVFRNFYYYDSRQCGSASIKYVLPVMSKLSHKDLEYVKKGDQASYEYERVTYDPSVSPEERQKIREALEKYCELDTLAEVEIVNGLKRAVKEC